MEDKIKELVELLSESELEFFNTLPPSGKKLFAVHALKSKVEKTRLRNIDEVKEAMELKCKNMHDYKRQVNPQKYISDDLPAQEKIKLYFQKLENKAAAKTMQELYDYLVTLDKDLSVLYAWNQPMIKYKETFICAISVAKGHFTVALENEALEFFKERVIANKYALNSKTFKIKYTQEIDRELLKEAVLFTIELKKDAKGFWK